MFKHYIRKKLEKYVRLYLSKHPDIKLVAVAGSVGKTSTKIAIATVLSQKYRVRVHGGNHNSELSAPLAILGITFPENIKSIGAWLAVFSEARHLIKSPSSVDVIVQELGTDRIGQIPAFGSYLNPDISVVTAVSPEHMEFFKNLDNVAREELAIADFSKNIIINANDIDDLYIKTIKNQNIETYGTTADCDYRFISNGFDMNKGYIGLFSSKNIKDAPIEIGLIGSHTIRSAVAAIAVAEKLGMSMDDIVNGVKRIKPVAGRMNILRGADESIIIDDSYNSSPLAVASSLNTLYSLGFKYRIAVLGSMNELGESAIEEHKKVGQLCDPNKLEWVVTVGDLANEYIASEARTNGCQVKQFNTALEAGAFVRSILKPGMGMLFKGSEGKIYLEEAVKIVLHASSDKTYLVRQSDDWMERKNKFFSKFN